MIVAYAPLSLTTTPIIGHIRYGPLAGMLLAHGPHPTIAFVSDRSMLADGPHATIVFVSDVAAMARPGQGIIHHAHMFSHNGHVPRSRAHIHHG